MEKIKLFCFPYAGGSAVVYNKWKSYLNGNIELCPVELPGRGRLFSSPFYRDMNEAVGDLFRKLSQDFTSSRYALFGHSMGSCLVYELSQQIRHSNLNQPLHLFFSGRRPPQIEKKEKIIHTLPNDEFIAEISDLGGTPREVLEHQELLDLFIPVIRADYKLVETYKYIERGQLESKISVFNGTRDTDTNILEMKEWGKCTRGDCKVYEFEGGHFFIHEHFQKIVAIINDTLQNSR
jgi:medium-chain acyl-[acyl-carrier-protein] hydrolase